MTKYIEINYTDTDGQKHQLKHILPDNAETIHSIYCTEEAPVAAMSFYEREPQKDEEDEIMERAG